MQAVDGFESDRESEEGQAEQPHPPATSSKSKATAPGKAEQRRTRKREKARPAFFTFHCSPGAQLNSINEVLSFNTAGPDLPAESHDGKKNNVMPWHSLCKMLQS